MGSSDSRSQFEHGHIVVQTSKPYFTPGEEVTGNIYLSMDQPFPATSLELEIKGKEEVKWKIRKNSSSSNSSHNRYHYTIKMEDKKQIFFFQATIYEFEDETVYAGQYDFPFKFLLPEDLPSSCYFSSYSQKARGMAQYKIKASLKCNTDDMKDMVFKQTLIIRQQPESIEMSTKADYNAKVYKCCCCCSEGTVTMQSETDKTIYTPTETVKIIGNIDNSNSKKDLKKIKVQLVQCVKMYGKRRKRDLLKTAFNDPSDFLFTAGDSEYNQEFVVMEKEYPGIKKGEMTDEESNHMELNLAEYGQEAYIDNSDEENEGEQSHASLDHEILAKDDEALRERIQPTSIGKIIQITYKLKITGDYGTCCGCSDPQTSIDLFITPPKLPSYQVLEPPPNWNPEIFESKNFTDPVSAGEEV
ncbi:unnamed protein product [Moneuplotes crassus]|uniref:Arrestin C-terminal-like domain-containing protein n=1 Tax=Euplotes crassus TaxID=5936 RepID=A0AAD1UQ02_EUPCR|nr:unnamed protein product [Moneuplotes crassus]